jgi:hypothetical protein
VNPSIREALLVPGTLKRSDVESPCVVSAVKVTIPKFELWEFVKADVVEAPAELPDGEYELHFEGRRFKATKNAGHWNSEYT